MDETSHVRNGLCPLPRQTVSEGDSKYWSLTTQLESHVQELVKAIQTPWETMFETTLPINYK